VGERGREEGREGGREGKRKVGRQNDPLITFHCSSTTLFNPHLG
jgi:hypothetical protein